MKIDPHIVAVIFDSFGTLLIAWVAIRVHHRVLKEHSIDKVVYRAMKNEQRTGLIGMLLVLFGFIVEVALV